MGTISKLGFQFKKPTITTTTNMGALTSTNHTTNHPQKRHLSHFSPTPDCHVSKRPRLLPSPYQIPPKTPPLPNPTVSRLSLYPQFLPKPRREVHAPVRVTKFGLARDLEVDRSSIGGPDSSSFVGMGNSVSKSYEIARELALGACRYIHNDRQKDVVELDNVGLDSEFGRKGAVGGCRFSSKEKEKEVNGVVDDEVLKLEFARDGVSRFVGEEKGKEVIDVDDEGLKGCVALRDDVDSSVEDDGVRVVEERSVVTVSNDGSGGLVENITGKALDLLALSNDIHSLGDVENVEVYKKLLETIERTRSGRLKTLGYQIQVEQKKRSALQSLRGLTKPKEDAVEEIPREPFIPLTQEEVAEVKRAFSANRRRILVSHKNSGIDITGELLQCLTPRAWLNDEVINVYLELLKEREKREPKKFLTCHFFNTFFYKKLTSGGKDIYDYKAVRRWTTERKLGYFLLDCDKIFVPIHREIHWCLAIINKKDQKFQYLDSLRGRDHKVLQHLARYYVEEVRDKTKKEIDVSNWEHEFVEDLPEQQNGYDCGVFMVKYADFYSRGLRLCFGQEHMPYFRQRTAKEILRLRAD